LHNICVHFYGMVKQVMFLRIRRWHVYFWRKKKAFVYNGDRD